MADTETPEKKDEATASSEAVGENGKAAERTLSPLLEVIQQPISEDEPGGEKVTYDEDFQEIKTQINSLESATGEIDYEQIIELGTKILREKSKDLTTICYLSLALAQEQRFEGVADGISGASLMMHTFWEELYPAPRRMSGRRNALQFLADRLKDWLNNCDDPTESDREVLLRAQQDLDDLQSFCMEEMEEHAPAFSGIKNALGKVVDRLPDLDEDEETEETTASSGTSTATVVDGDIQSASDAKRAIKQSLSFLREEQEQADPLPYRLIRVLRWEILQEEPPSENGETRIEPPLEQRRTYLNGLSEKGEHETLLEEAEASFQNSPFHFWLDLQRLVAGALEALGEEYAPVRKAVLAETALLVHRLPQLSSLTFTDGTPLADPLTRDWLETTVQPVFGEERASTGEVSEAAPDEDGASLQEQHRDAQQQLGAGTLQDALTTMREGAAQDATQKDRFRRRLFAADLCVKGQKPAVARPILERLAEEIDHHALDTWDPPLALEVWSNLHTCYKTLVRSAPQSQKKTFNQKANTVFEKICKLDPTQALSLGGT